MRTLVVSGLLQVNNHSRWLKNGGGFPLRMTVVSFRWRTTALGYRRRKTVVGFKWRTLVVSVFLQVNNYVVWLNSGELCTENDSGQFVVILREGQWLASHGELKQ